MRPFVSAKEGGRLGSLKTHFVVKIAHKFLINLLEKHYIEIAVLAFTIVQSVILHKIFVRLHCLVNKKL